MPLNYNAPIDGVRSTIDDVTVDGKKSDQMRSFMWLRKAVITAREKQFFTQLADVTAMPKHYGKTIKVYEYVPLLDDRNNNTMGLNVGGVLQSGNLYGSSKDIGTIQKNLPNLTENGGRVNRVGFTRIQREGAIKNYGIFTEFTKESLDFDSDDQLLEHLSRELVNGAVEISEDLVQMDLLDAAAHVLFPGSVADDEGLTGDADSNSDDAATVVDYELLMRLDQILTDNRTPMNTEIITGSRFIDTRVIAACRVLYVGSEIVPLLRRMKDSFGNKVFIEVHHYAAAVQPLVGEIGSIGHFRIIMVPKMLHWNGKAPSAPGAGDGHGTIVGSDGNAGYRTTADDVTGDEYYNVYPMLVVGSKSFTAIGFQTNGKVMNLTAMTKMPGMATMGQQDPYGALGVSSLQWYQGTLILRPERIGMIKTVAPL